MITQERLKELFTYDELTGIFKRKTRVKGSLLSGRVGWLDSHGYITMSVDHRKYRAHRLAWLYVYGEWPEHLIDHIDRDKTNNALSNLRASTKSLNGFNTSLRSTNNSGSTGIALNRGKWRARIMINYVEKHLGRFNSFNEAVAARIAAEKLYNIAEYRPQI